MNMIANKAGEISQRESPLCKGKLYEFWSVNEEENTNKVGPGMQINSNKYEGDWL